MFDMDFSSTCWPFVYLLWENDHIGPFSIYELGDFVFLFAIELYEFFECLGY